MIKELIKETIGVVDKDIIVEVNSPSYNGIKADSVIFKIKGKEKPTSTTIDKLNLHNDDFLPLTDSIGERT